MSPRPRIVGISGSLRSGSYNTKLPRAATTMPLGGGVLVIWDRLKAVPPYDGDDEANPPAGVAELRNVIAAADAILFATPEYNRSIPGQLKNALDWASRPFATNVLRNKPVAVVGASTGVRGAAAAQAELRKVLTAIGASVLADEVAVGHASSRFDETGGLSDDGIRSALAEVVHRLARETARTPIAA